MRSGSVRAGERDLPYGRARPSDDEDRAVSDFFAGHPLALAVSERGRGPAQVLDRAQVRRLPPDVPGQLVFRRVPYPWSAAYAASTVSGEPPTRRKWLSSSWAKS